MVQDTQQVESQAFTVAAFPDRVAGAASARHRGVYVLHAAAALALSIALSPLPAHAKLLRDGRLDAAEAAATGSVSPLSGKSFDTYRGPFLHRIAIITATDDDVREASFAALAAVRPDMHAFIDRRIEDQRLTTTAWDGPSAFNDVAASAVPEPATWAFLLLGIAGLALHRRGAVSRSRR